MKIENCKVGRLVVGKETKKHYMITAVNEDTVDVEFSGAGLLMTYTGCSPKLFRLPAKEIK